MNLWPNVQTPPIKERPSLHKIGLSFCRVYDEHIADVRGERQFSRLVLLRKKITREARQLGYTQQEIADYLHKDHSTIVHYLSE